MVKGNADDDGDDDDEDHDKDNDNGNDSNVDDYDDRLVNSSKPVRNPNDFALYGSKHFGSERLWIVR